MVNEANQAMEELGDELLKKHSNEAVELAGIIAATKVALGGLVKADNPGRSSDVGD